MISSVATIFPAAALALAVAAVQRARRRGGKAVCYDQISPALFQPYDNVPTPASFGA